MGFLEKTFKKAKFCINFERKKSLWNKIFLYSLGTKHVMVTFRPGQQFKTYRPNTILQPAIFQNLQFPKSLGYGENGNRFYRKNSFSGTKILG